MDDHTEMFVSIWGDRGSHGGMIVPGFKLEEHIIYQHEDAETYEIARAAMDLLRLVRLRLSKREVTEG